MTNVLWLIVGGSAGTLSRYYLARLLEARLGALFPYGTLGVNLLGCLVIGLLLGFFETRFATLAAAPLNIRLLLMTGFLGAFTTFSTFEMEAFLFVREGQWEKALLYVAISLAAGLALVAGGFTLGRWSVGGLS